MKFFSCFFVLFHLLVPTTGASKVYSSGEVPSDLERPSFAGKTEILNSFNDYMSVEGNSYRLINGFLRGTTETAEKYGNPSFLGLSELETGLAAVDDHDWAVQTVFQLLKGFRLFESALPAETVSSLPADLTLFRGTNFCYLQRFPRVGEIIGDGAFQSTSLDSSTALSFAISSEYCEAEFNTPAVMVIYSSVGYSRKVMRIAPTAAAGDNAPADEGEVLFHPSTHFIVRAEKNISPVYDYLSEGNITRKAILMEYCGAGESAEETCAEIQDAPVPVDQAEFFRQLAL